MEVNRTDFDTDHQHAMVRVGRGMAGRDRQCVDRGVTPHEAQVRSADPEWEIEGSNDREIDARGGEPSATGRHQMSQRCGVDAGYGDGVASGGDREFAGVAVIRFHSLRGPGYSRLTWFAGWFDAIERDRSVSFEDRAVSLFNAHAIVQPRDDRSRDFGRREEIRNLDGPRHRKFVMRIGNRDRSHGLTFVHAVTSEF